MKEKRASLIVRGLVQGVFFRDSTRRKALEIGLVGMVRNRRDGSVEIVVEGPPEAVERMVAWAQSGPPSAVVTDVVKMVQEASGEFEGFEVWPTV